MTHQKGSKESVSLREIRKFCKKIVEEYNYELRRLSHLIPREPKKIKRFFFLRKG